MNKEWFTAVLLKVWHRPLLVVWCHSFNLSEMGLSQTNHACFVIWSAKMSCTINSFTGNILTADAHQSIMGNIFVMSINVFSSFCTLFRTCLTFGYHPDRTGGHGSVQVPEEKSDQFILLWTSCKCLRALPRLQSHQGQYHTVCVHWCDIFVTHRDHIKILCFLPFQCIVQSYLQWLQDSDYNPNCALCKTPLSSQDTVRLICYGTIVVLSSP